MDRVSLLRRAVPGARRRRRPSGPRALLSAARGRCSGRAELRGMAPAIGFEVRRDHLHRGLRFRRRPDASEPAGVATSPWDRGRACPGARAREVGARGDRAADLDRRRAGNRAGDRGSAARLAPGAAAAQRGRALGRRPAPGAVRPARIATPGHGLASSGDPARPRRRGPSIPGASRRRPPPGHAPPNPLPPAHSPRSQEPGGVAPGHGPAPENMPARGPPFRGGRWRTLAHLPRPPNP